MDINELENKSIYLIRESFTCYKNIALLWSMGKDSTALLWMCRKAFFGCIPFPVIHIDTSYKFKEIYEFRERIAKLWGLNLIVSRNEDALAQGMNYKSGRFECCHALKTQTLNQTIQKHQLAGILLGIRRDEHGIRAKERYFSPRSLDQKWDFQDQPPELWDLSPSQEDTLKHFRIHPLLHWTEIDIWEYTQREKIPYVNLYLAQKDQRYRSIGCETCCSSFKSKANSIPQIIQEIKSSADAERSGRSQDKEDAYMMQKLRSLGYM